MNVTDLFPLNHGETVEDRLQYVWRNKYPSIHNYTIRYLYHVHMRFALKDKLDEIRNQKEKGTLTMDDIELMNEYDEQNVVLNLLDEDTPSVDIGNKKISIFRDVILIDELLLFSVVKLNNDPIVGNWSHFSLVNDDSFQDELVQMRQKLIQQAELDHILQVVFVTVAVALPGSMGLCFIFYLIIVMFKAASRRFFHRKENWQGSYRIMS